MKDKPSGLHELLRRALVAERELGNNEILLSARLSKAGNTPSVKLSMSESAHAISAEEAVQSVAIQPGLTLMPKVQYASVTEHRDAICDCQRCALGATRNKFVYGVGNPAADLMFIGEAPGADEDRLGEPFVGRAGKLLDKILAAMGFSRNQIYIANILKCRPPGNRDPQPEEMSQCFPYLREQIQLIRPKLLCALGRVAAQALLSTNIPLGKLRGSWHEFEAVPLMVTYHPAALLRFPAYKKDTWEDMQRLKAEYDKLT